MLSHISIHLSFRIMIFPVKCYLIMVDLQMQGRRQRRLFVLYFKCSWARSHNHILYISCSFTTYNIALAHSWHRCFNTSCSDASASSFEGLLFIFPIEANNIVICNIITCVQKSVITKFHSLCRALILWYLKRKISLMWIFFHSNSWMVIWKRKFEIQPFS